MRMSETNAATKKIGLRIAALTGAVLSASVLAAAPATSADIDVVLDSVVSVHGGGGNGSTCCRPVEN